MEELTQWNDDHIIELELIKAPQNWGEMTGPFFHLHLPDHEPLGPFHAHELKEFTEGIELPEGSLVRDAKGFGEWVNFYEHPFFQRRKPQILDEQNPMAQNSFHIITDGIKLGPLGPDELMKLVNQKEVLLTDQASSDGGHTWHKLYEFSQFDRRNFSQGPLPESPGWEVFKGSNEEMKESLHADDETGALASLAFLENIKSGKAHLPQEENNQGQGEIPTEETSAKVLEFQAPEKATETESSTLRYGTYALISFFMLGSLFFFFNENKNPARVTQKNSRSSASETTDAPTLKPVKERGNYQPTRFKAKNSPRSRKPASITTTNSFEPSNRRELRDSAYDDSYPEDNYDNAYQDDYAYDNGDTPVEQDPVRSRLDKKIIDSENNYYDEEERYDYDANYEEEVPVDAPTIEASEVWGAGKTQGRLPAAEDDYQDEFLDGEALEENY